MASGVFYKDPSAELDFVFDWSSWLASGETISTYALTVPTGITLSTDLNSSVTVTAWLSTGTAGTEYDVACKIVTSSSRTDERSMRIVIFDR